MSRPVWQRQGPADNCQIDGENLGWLSCTAYAAAMALDAATHGRIRVSGCYVRRRTGDIEGGLRLDQVEPVIESFGINVTRKTGANYATAGYLAARIRVGHPTILQGNAGALIGTRHQSTAGFVNHAVDLADGRSWRTVNGLYRPDEVLTYDSAADGRLYFAQGPQWWSWNTLLRFAGALRPNGDDDARTLGYGRAWAAFLTPELPDTGSEELVYSIKGVDGPFPCTVKAGTPYYASADDQTQTGTLNDPTRPFMCVGESEDGDRRAVYGKTSLAAERSVLGWVASDRVVR